MRTMIPSLGPVVAQIVGGMSSSLSSSQSSEKVVSKSPIQPIIAITCEIQRQMAAQRFKLK